MFSDMDESDDGSIYPDQRDAENARLKAEHAEMLALLRRFANLPPLGDRTIDEETWALLARIDGKASC